MLFYEFYMTYECSEGSLMASMQGDGRELWIEHISELNMLLGLQRLQEKHIYVIHHDIKKRFDMFVIANQLKPITPKEIEKELSKLLAEYELTNIKVQGFSETTCKRIYTLYGQCRAKQYILKDRMLETLRIDYMRNEDFHVEENISIAKKIYKKEAVKLAQDIMADKSLIEEIERIYSVENDRGSFYGHPVHYRIIADSMDAAMKMIRLLIRALYSNNRLTSCRINRICNINDNLYSKSEFKDAVRCAEGSVVIIGGIQTESGELCYTESSDKSTNFIADVLRQFRRYTLSIIVEIGKNTQVTSGLIEKLSEDMDFIAIEEGVGNRKNAVEYLKMLERTSDFPQHTDEEIKDALGDKTSFRASEVHNVFDNMTRTVLKEKKYVSYKNINTTMPHTVIEQIDKPYDLLHDLIGLSEQKAIAQKIIATFGIRKLRAEMGFPVKKMSLHMCFTGNPGSAKTETARILAAILSEEGILQSGKLVECGRADLVGQYVGHTAVQVKKKFNKARGGILFIDEAYALADGHAGSFGDEAIATIVQEMENHRDDVVVIFAGYPKKMEDFLSRNEGLRSRITFHLHFPDYNEQELVDILLFMAKRRGFVLSQEIVRKCRSIFKEVCHQPDFGNGRYVRNLLEQAIMRQSERLWSKHKIGMLEREDLSALEENDFEAISQAMKTTSSIGFAVAI